MKTKNDKTISADFSFESKFLEIYGSKMHYIEEGEGDPILFLHGNPSTNDNPHMIGKELEKWYRKL